METQTISNRSVFDPTVPGFNEAYYVIWTDPAQELSMVIRYVLFNGPTAETQVAQVWAWFRDRRNNVDCAFRQVYPLDQASWSGETCDLRIGAASGLSDEKAWGRILVDEIDLRWEFDLHSDEAIGVDRMLGTGDSSLFPRFQSPRCKHQLSGTVQYNDRSYTLERVNATDGHYWNVQNLQTWSWANCVSFQERPGTVLEAIGYQLYRQDSPVSVSASFGSRESLEQTSLPEGVFRNRELVSELEEWQIEANFDQSTVRATITGKPEDMILIVHPLPDGGALYTTITLTGDARVEIIEANGSSDPKVTCVTARDSVAFEVTKPVRNPRVSREFLIVPAPPSLTI